MSAVRASRPEPEPFSEPPDAPDAPSLVVPPMSPRPALARPATPLEMAPSRRGDTLKMAAVRGPQEEETPPSGRMLDPASMLPPALELAPRRPPSGKYAAVKTPASAFSPVGTSEVIRRVEALDPRRPGIFAFAGFGLPPETFAGTPAYALRVLRRRRILRAGLAVARRQGSADVELYEAALRTADPDAYAKGLLAICLVPVFVAALLGIASALLL